MRELYTRADSLVHRLGFWTKFVCFLILVPVAGFLSAPRYLPLVLAILVCSAWLSRVGLWKFWTACQLYVLAVALFVGSIYVIFGEGGWGNRLSSAGFLVLRFVALVGFGVLFAMVTNPVEIPTAFLRARLPHRYGVTLMVAYRMWPLITQKIGGVVAAQQARGAAFGLSWGGLKRLPQNIIALAVPLVYSALDLSLSLSDTLVARGYDPNGRITVPPARSGTADVLVVSACLAFLSLVIWFSR